MRDNLRPAPRPFSYSGKSSGGLSLQLCSLSSGSAPVTDHASTEEVPSPRKHLLPAMLHVYFVPLVTFVSAPIPPVYKTVRH
jgi:hypothetical protein